MEELNNMSPQNGQLLESSADRSYDLNSTLLSVENLQDCSVVLKRIETKDEDILDETSQKVELLGCKVVLERLNDTSSNQDHFVGQKWGRQQKRKGSCQRTAKLSRGSLDCSVVLERIEPEGQGPHFFYFVVPAKGYRDREVFLRQDKYAFISVAVRSSRNPRSPSYDGRRFRRRRLYQHPKNDF